MPTPTIYIVSDGKPGHLAQSRGLAAAIARLAEVECIEVPADSAGEAPAPQQARRGLILAAGRVAHGRALSLRRRFGLPAIALMNPGWLSRRRFDLCVIPKHDGVAASGRVIVTEGALNGNTRATGASPSEGLLLIGGPSKHHGWDDSAIYQQLSLIVERDPGTRWTVTGSRRTPASTDRQLRELADQHAERFVYTPASETPRGWVADQLQRCGVCWVTEDSVSMVYEALTAGARVGLLAVPHRSKHPGRVVRGVESLVRRGWVTTFSAWRDGEPLPVDRPPLAEADRVAQIVLDRFSALTQ